MKYIYILLVLNLTGIIGYKILNKDNQNEDNQNEDNQNQNDNQNDNQNENQEYLSNNLKSNISTNSISTQTDLSNTDMLTLLEYKNDLENIYEDKKYAWKYSWKFI